jgi:hypothetical protein
LLAGDDSVDVTVRFLHVVERSLFDADGATVDELVAGGARYLAWEEATEREVRALAGRSVIDIPAGRESEVLPGGTGTITRSWTHLRGAVVVTVAPVEADASRVTVLVENETPWNGDDRRDALRHTFCSTHVVLRTEDGSFVSATESDCENVGLWPVLVGEEGTTDTVLAAPIILSDYPQIAPESPGDLFDATEIDKLLILNVLALTPEEQEEMRASDPRAREILERCSSLSPEQLMQLHGAMRELRPVTPP